MSSVKLQSIVSKQLPEFVREDFPVFVTFLKKYYEYLETIDSRNIEDLRDIDKTADEYIQYFNNEFAFLNSPDFSTANIDPRLYLRKSKQIFNSKGSEDAFKFLFRVLYNKNVDVTYPWDSVLKTSDGKWNQDTSIFVNVTSGNVNSLIGNQVTVYGTNTRVKVTVDRISNVRDNIYEIFINKNFYGNISINDTIKFNGVTGTVGSTISGYSIENPGKGYRVGDLIRGSEVFNNITINQLIKVTKVDSNGGILKVQPIEFGTGYANDFYLLALKENQTVVAQSSLSAYKDGNLQYFIPDDSAIDKYTEYGYMSKPNVWDINYAEATSAGEVIEQFSYITPTNQPINIEYALIKFNIGAVARYQGYYSTNDGFLDDTIKLQDSKYYQKYSYQLTVDEALSSYKNYIMTVMHAAGMKLFSEYQIQNQYTLGLSAEIFVDIT
jgi:hypothetical protein